MTIFGWNLLRVTDVSFRSFFSVFLAFHYIRLLETGQVQMRHTVLFWRRSIYRFARPAVARDSLNTPVFFYRDSFQFAHPVGGATASAHAVLFRTEHTPQYNEKQTYHTQIYPKQFPPFFSPSFQFQINFADCRKLVDSLTTLLYHNIRTERNKVNWQSLQFALHSMPRFFFHR